MKKRIEWVDIGKYICIMFVMLTHLESKTRVLKAFFNPFFLNVFFFLAGYVYNNSVTFKNHFIKKVKGLFVPWLIFSNISVLLSSILTFNGGHNLKSDFIWNLLQIRPLGDVMWFVPALFMAFIPFYFFIKKGDKTKTVIIAFILSVISKVYTEYMPADILPWGNSSLPWHIEYIFVAMFWMVLGYYFKTDYEEFFDRYDNNKVFLIITGLYLLSVYGPVYFNVEVFNILFSYVQSILGVSMIIMLCKRMKTNKYISFVGANTILYFAFHGKLLALIEHVLRSKANGFYSTCLNNVLYSSILAIVITVTMSFVLIIPAYCVNRWFPWIVGRSRKAK